MFTTGYNALDASTNVHCENNTAMNGGSYSGCTNSHGTHVAGLIASTTDNNTGIASTAFNCSILSVKVSDENQSGQIYITDGFAGLLYAAKAGYFSEGFTIVNNTIFIV